MTEVIIIIIAVACITAFCIWFHKNFMCCGYPIRKTMLFFDENRKAKMGQLEEILEIGSTGRWIMTVEDQQGKHSIPCRVDLNRFNVPKYAYFSVPFERDDTERLANVFLNICRREKKIRRTEQNAIDRIVAHLRQDVPEMTVDLFHRTKAEMQMQAILETSAKK